MNIQLEQFPKLLAGEALRNRYWLVGAFVAVNVALVTLGLIWPKVYSTSTTIYIEERNIIQPLMQGTAVATNLVDRAKIAREVIFSRKIMNQVLDYTGWLKNNPSDIEQEKIMESLKARTRITNVTNNLLKIEYQDENPERAYRTAQKISDLFIFESTGTQSRESVAAFDFIDSQVAEYHDKLTSAEESLKDFRSNHVDARPGTEGQITGKINALETVIEKTALELKEAKIKQASIEKQLSGEAAVTTSVSREGQYAARIAELQGQLDTLRLSYHETYPDVIRLKHQVDDLREMVELERGKREKAATLPKAGDSLTADESVRFNPIYQKLRADLLETRTVVETLSTRLSESQQLLKVELGRATKMYGGEATLAELTRDYEVNRDIYQDLLKRRENARVSKNLDTNKQGLTMRVQDPAVLPLQPTGLRFMHFVLTGLLLGIALPAGMLIALPQIDPRIRLPGSISGRINVAVLASIPHLPTPAETVAMQQSFSKLGFAVFATLGFVAAASVLKMTGLL